MSTGIGSRSMKYKNVTYRWSWHESKRLWETWGDVVTPLCPHYRLCTRRKIKAEGCKTFVFMLLLCPWFRKAAVWTVHKEMSINKLHMTALVAWLFHVVPHTACLQNSQLLKGICCKFQDSAAICINHCPKIRRLPVPSFRTNCAQTMYRARRWAL